MKTKRFLIAVLTAALVTAFIIGCNVQPDDTGLEIVKVNDAKDQPAPSGKIKVRLNLADTESNARTVYPTGTSAYTSADDFNYFLLKVYKGSTDVTPVSGTLSTYFTHSAFASETLTLDEAGTYAFAIIACTTNDDDTTEYLAFGYKTETIDEPQNSDPIEPITSVTIKLGEIVGNNPAILNHAYDGMGKFEWDLDVSTYDSASLTLAPVGNQTNYVNPFIPSPPFDLTYYDDSDHSNIIDNSSGFENISPGYYMMVITLTKSGYQTAYVREIVHIYSGFTSTYSITLPTLRSRSYPVNFNYGNDTTDTGRPASKPVTHGTMYSSVLSQGTNVTTLTHSSPSYYRFDGWLLNGSALDTSDYVIKTVTLVANWHAYRNPVAEDFQFSNLTQMYKEAPVDAVTVTPNTNKSDGTPTVYYTGVSLTYEKSTTVPTNVGTYSVTFDIDEDNTNDWSPAIGLSAGQLEITKATPVAGDFNFGKTTQAWNDGDPVEHVTVTPKATTKSNGTVTLHYTSSDPAYNSGTPPSAPGVYDVTFSIAATANWNANSGLSAGTLTINSPTPQYFHISLDWTEQAEEPTISNDSAVSYDPVNKKLTIYINITNTTYSSAGFVWKVDFSDDPLNSTNNVLSDTIILDLTDPDDLNWLLDADSARYFDVTISNLYSFKIILED